MVINDTNHKYPYKWNLKDAVFTKDKGKVFSCFSCGGGSTMGYKLAGFDVIGCNEIDPKMMECYIANHNPKYSYLEPIQTFKNRADLPDELYNLDILDGSPPCSSFSMAGKREKDWGKKKKFREGQSSQMLDNLFFDFIDLVKRLQPKIVIAENVKGLLQGEAKSYLKRIISSFIEAGYRVDYKLLDASKMGVPQRRERVFFYAVRRDIECDTIDLFNEQPRLDLNFNEPKISFKDCELDDSTNGKKVTPGMIDYYFKCNQGSNMSTVSPKGKNYWFNYIKIDPNKPMPTLAGANNNKLYHYEKPEQLSLKQWCVCGSYPLDYNFLEDGRAKNDGRYLIGMSVPPVMTAQIASRVYDQWLRPEVQ